MIRAEQIRAVPRYREEFQLLCEYPAIRQWPLIPRILENLLQCAG